jgi:hypothetical protein
MTPGILPCAAPPPASLFAPLLRRSAQKVTKKARHRTRWSDSHRANRTALCFSPAPGCLDSTSMYCFASAAIHRRAPSGIFRHGLRCSAPRTVPLIYESVRPCTTLRWGCGKTQLLLLLSLLRQDAAEPGPPEARRGCAGSVRRRAHTMCARSLNVHGRTSSEPRSTLADLEGRMPGRRAVGGVFLWLPFFAQAKKVTRSPQASGSSALELRAQRRASRVVMNLANPVTDLT